MKYYYAVDRYDTLTQSILNGYTKEELEENEVEIFCSSRSEILPPLY